MASTDLVTLDEVRSFLGKQTTQTADDDALTAIITRASEVIQRHLDIKILPRESATVRVPWDGHQRIDLTPYVARTVTEVVLDPDEDTETTLSVGQWKLRPIPAKHGVYLRLELDWSVLPAYTGYFPSREATVTGTFGFEAVPDAIKHACCVTAATWYRRDQAQFSTVYNEVEGRVERPEALPAAVVKTLALWRRPVI